MLPLHILQKVSNANRAKFLQKHGERPVRIVSRQWGAYWRPNAKGYTDDTAQAGTYTLNEALAASGHCGPEKKIYYQFI